MGSEHPVYSRPTIVEAVCDIRFRLSQVNSWKPTLFGEFFKRIQDEYPEMEPVSEVGMQVEFGPSSLSQKFLPQPQKMRFKHKDRPLLIQLAENSLSVNTLQPYGGWALMRSDILSVWSRAEEILKPEAADRIGLRYINRFDKETDRDRPGDWLKASDYISEGILRSESGFLLRMQVHLNNENVLIVTLGDTTPTLDERYGAIVFDIDRILEKEIVLGREGFKQELDQLHAEVWNVFSSAKGERLERFLNRREQ